MVLAVAAEPHAAELLRDLRELRAGLLDRHPGARLLAIWDLDGTLLHGDCSEGLVESGHPVYPGLVQRAIEHGCSGDYAPAGGFARARQDYELLKVRFGAWLAYPFLAQMFAGADPAVLTELSARHFAEVLAPYFFASSRSLFDGLAADGVEQHVISASAEFFVHGAAGVLGLPPARLHGIRLRVEDGRLTRDVLSPVTFAAGKRQGLLEILAPATDLQDRPTFVLAGFGNHFATDGALLQQIGQQPLPVGEPVAVMINAGDPPPEYRGQFRVVHQAKLVGAV